MNRWAPVLGLLLAGVAGVAAAAEWRLDPAGSRLALQASYQGEPVPAVVKQFDTRLRFDPENLAGSRLEVRVKLPSVDFGSSDIDEAVRAPEWFDFARFPDATFVSTDIRRVAPDRYLARGTLQLKGAARAVAVPFSWNASDKSAAMKGELTLNRTNFGVGTGEWQAGDLIGLDVKVVFDLRLQAG